MLFRSRGPIGCRVMEAGKDYFTDKTPFTSLDQLDQAKATVARTKLKYMVYFSERLHVEAAMYATDLVAGGAFPGMVTATIGTVLLVAVAWSSVVVVRRRLNYELWYAIHLTAYAAIALSWFHEIPTGGDINDQLDRKSTRLNSSHT